jgi:hypothetical protein
MHVGQPAVDAVVADGELGVVDSQGVPVGAGRGETLSVAPRPDAAAPGSGRTQDGYGIGLMSLVRESGPIW